MADRVQAVIFDWAGTVVDYGCFAPMHAFLTAFEREGVPVTIQEAREPMGLLKRDHIEALLRMDRVRNEWVARFGSEPTVDDRERLYEIFETTLMESLEQYAAPVPGAVEAVAQLRQAGVKIGSTTGYTKDMLEVVATGAKRQGYEPDFKISSDEVKAGRPYPYMIYRNLYELEVFPPRAAVKIGDTVSDVREAVNAGVWSIAVMKGGSELGMTEAEVEAAPASELRQRMDGVRHKFEAAGADIVIESIAELPSVVEEINRRLGMSQRGGESQ